MSALVGHPLPAFALQDDQGATLTPSGPGGPWTVLYAYPKDYTPGCTIEACDFRDNWERVQSPWSAGLRHHQGQREEPPEFHRQAGTALPPAERSRGALLKPLGAFGKKIMYGKEVEGIIRSTFLVDPKGVIRHVWPKVSVKGHVEDVLDTLKKLKG